MRRATLLGHARAEGKEVTGAGPPMAQGQIEALEKEGGRGWASSAVGLKRRKREKEKKKKNLFSFSGFYKLAPNSN